MKTRRFIPVVLAGLSASIAFAQNAGSPVTKPVTQDAAAPVADSASAASAAKPVRPRAVSDETAATIMAGMPKFNPPPKKPEPKPEEEQTDLREVDKPKNGIIRLPKYTVQEKRPAVLQERDTYTKQGLAEMARRRYITDSDHALNGWSVLGTHSLAGGDSTTARALAMYADDERLKNMSDLNDAARDAAKTDTAAGAYIKRLSRDTYMRTSDFGWNGGPGHPDKGINDAATAPR